MKFGVNLRGRLTGAELAVRVFQIATLLPLSYILLASGYPYLYTHEGLFSVLFDLGLASLPKAEALALSLLFRRSASEILAFFTALAAAIAFGLLAERLLKGSERLARGSRRAWLGLIALDLILRCLPLPFAPLPLYAQIIGFLVRLGCLLLILLDLRAARA